MEGTTRPPAATRSFNALTLICRILKELLNTQVLQNLQRLGFGSTMVETPLGRTYDVVWRVFNVGAAEIPETIGDAEHELDEM